eukprot:gene31517-6697_t
MAAVGQGRRASVGGLAMFVLLVALIRPILGKLSCEESGYCSLGQTKQFVGDISQPGNLRKLLESTAFKQEIILIQMSGSKLYIEMMFQLRFDFKELGMDHIVVLASQEDVCKAFLTFEEDMSCVWDASLMHKGGFVGFERAIHGRIRFLARASRMGYNVMSFDRWMDDDFNLTNSFGRETGHLCLGFEQSFLDAALQSTMVQRPIYHQMLASCVPGAREGNTSSQQAGWRKASGSSISKWDAIDAQSAAVNCHESMESSHAPVPASWPAMELKAEFTEMHAFNMTAPAWFTDIADPAFGGRYFDRSGGVYSGAFIAQMKDDCPDCPWWPDEDRKAASKITESFAFVPRWLVSSAWLLNTGSLTPLDGGEARQVAVHAHCVPGTIGRQDKWHYMPTASQVRLGGNTSGSTCSLRPRYDWEARQVAVHAQCIPGTFGSTHMKIGVRRPYNRYHFEYSKALHSHPNGPTFLKSPGPYMVGLEAPKRLLILHPDVDLSWVANPEEYRIITLGLIQLAMLSSRTLVFPDLPCNTSMVFDFGSEGKGCDGSSYLHLRRREYMPWAALKDATGAPNGPRSLRLNNPFLWLDACINTSGLTGLLHMEFERFWLKYDRPAGANVEAGTQNTAFIPKDPNLATVDASSSEWSLGEVIVSLSPQEAFDELAKYDKEAVVYVRHPVTVRAVSHNSTQPQEPLEASKEYPDVVLPVNWTGRFEQITSTCAGVFKNPFVPWFSKSLGVPEDAKGVPGHMEDGHLSINEGATYPGKAKKPWTEKDGPLFG